MTEQGVKLVLDWSDAW